MRLASGEDSGDEEERGDACAAAVALEAESNDGAAEDLTAAAAVKLEENGRFVAESPSNSWSSFNSQMR